MLNKAMLLCNKISSTVYVNPINMLFMIIYPKSSTRYSIPPALENGNGLYEANGTYHTMRWVQVASNGFSSKFENLTQPLTLRIYKSLGYKYALAAGSWIQIESIEYSDRYEYKITVTDTTKSMLIQVTKA